MYEPTITRKEAIWLACKQKSCCFAPLVVPTGRDVWRIARALGAPPESFLLYFPTPVARRDAFVLDHSGQEFRIALGKGRARRPQAPRPCLFLLRTRTGHHRCALGELRPVVCRAFPADLVDGVLGLANDGRCSCRTWALADVDLAEETALVEARQRAAEEYCLVVASWNARVAATPAGSAFTFAEFCAYVLETYDQLAGAPGGAGGDPP
jgi:hypothetical protein